MASSGERAWNRRDQATCVTKDDKLDREWIGSAENSQKIFQTSPLEDDIGRLLNRKCVRADKRHY